MSFLLTRIEQAVMTYGPSFLMRLEENVVTNLVASNSSVLIPMASGPGNKLVPGAGIFCPNSFRFHAGSTGEYIRIGSSGSVNPTSGICVLVILSNIRNAAGEASSIFSCVGSYGYSMNIGADGSITFNVNDGSKFVSCSFDKNKLNETGSLMHATYDGRYVSIYVDGVLCAQKDNGSVKTIRYGGTDLFIATGATLTGLKADFDCFLFGVYSFALTSAQVAAQYDAFIEYKKISGTAILDNGNSAAKVVIASIDNKQIANIIPSASGAFDASVPPGDYLVTACGPAGYRPISHGPVTAVDP